MKISILGSTGSIGRQTLEIIRDSNIKIEGLVCYKNIKLLKKQILEFKPEKVCVVNEAQGKKLKESLSSIRIFYGINGLKDFIENSKGNFLIAIPGSYAIEPLYYITKKSKKVYNASKEAYVAIANLVDSKKIIPIDSEHIGVLQCIKGDFRRIRRIFISATGGPFIDKGIIDYSIKEVLSHPVWKMGKKITVDSATLMNKGFEIIEASFVFNISQENIVVILNKKGEFHGGVEFGDGSVILNFSKPDMKKTIAYALNIKTNSRSYIPSAIEFKKIDERKFECMKIARECLKKGGSYLPALVAADDLAVESFLNERIKFTKIPVLIRNIIEKHNSTKISSIEDVISIVNETRKIGEDILSKI
ncbi:MAG: 1-deoxy-D-xylulose-5-phosphate reductoisomerase [bacterium]|nr:1-deoxy-D-xylulose-5-phosphate reductoisomerase [bacterium]